VANNSRDRKERQAAALRENLKRRKARTRALAETGETAAGGPQASDVEPAPAPSAPRPNAAAKNT
jgi:hypothetical protein